MVHRWQFISIRGGYPFERGLLTYVSLNLFLEDPDETLIDPYGKIGQNLTVFRQVEVAEALKDEMRVAICLRFEAMISLQQFYIFRLRARDPFYNRSDN